MRRRPNRRALERRRRLWAFLSKNRQQQPSYRETMREFGVWWATLHADLLYLESLGYIERRGAVRARGVRILVPLLEGHLACVPTASPLSSPDGPRPILPPITASSSA